MPLPRPLQVSNRANPDPQIPAKFLGGIYVVALLLGLIVLGALY